MRKNYTDEEFARLVEAAADDLFVADAIFLLNALFVPGSPQTSCEDAADANDDGTLNIGDAVYKLNALFVPGSPQPPAPFPDCGVDPTGDPLECDSFPAC